MTLGRLWQPPPPWRTGIQILALTTYKALASAAMQLKMGTAGNRVAVPAFAVLAVKATVRAIIWSASGLIIIVQRTLIAQSLESQRRVRSSYGQTTLAMRLQFLDRSLKLRDLVHKPRHVVFQSVKWRHAFRFMRFMRVAVGHKAISETT